LKSEVRKLSKSQLEIKITVPHHRVGEVFDEVLDSVSKEIEIEGFRKGHAPKNLVKEKIDKSKVYGEVANRLVAESYNAAVKEHLLKPIVSPQIEIIQFEPESDKEFIFKAITAERPEVKLGDYKKELAKLKVQKPSKEIVGPDGKPIKSSSQPSGPSSPSINEVLTTVLKIATVEIPDILIENEVTRMLSRLIDQTARLGLTVEQYLQSVSKTLEQLKAEYKKQAEETLKAEFVLEEIAKAENIQVTDKEVNEAIRANPDEKTRRELEKEENKWYIKSILKRNKTLQKLLDLAK